MKLQKPKNADLYGIWHHCEHCGRTYTHSQADFNEIKKSQCCIENLRDHGRDQKEVDWEQF